MGTHVGHAQGTHTRASHSTVKESITTTTEKAWRRVWATSHATSYEPGVSAEYIYGHRVRWEGELKLVCGAMGLQSLSAFGPMETHLSHAGAQWTVPTSPPSWALKSGHSFSIVLKVVQTRPFHEGVPPSCSPLSKYKVRVAHRKRAIWRKRVEGAQLQSR